MIRNVEQALTPADADSANRIGILHWMLAGAIAFLPVQIETGFSIRFAVSDVFLLLTMIVGATTWRLVRPAWSVWHFGILALIALSVLYKTLIGDVAQTDIVNKLGGIILLSSLYMCLTTLGNSWPRIIFFLRVFVVAISLHNMIACAAFMVCKYTGNTHPVIMFLLSDSPDRLAGMLVDANAYGGMLTVAFAVALLCHHPDRPLLPNWLRMICMITLAMGLVLTSSRSAWLGFGVLCLIGIVQNPRLLLVLPLLAIAGFGALVFSFEGQDLDNLVTLSSRKNTIDERIEIIHDAWRMFFENPILGGGIGSFYSQYNIIVHNTTMWFLAEFGVVGFSIFAGLIIWYGVRGFGAYQVLGPERRPVIGGLLAAHLAMIGFSQGVEAFYQRNWWFVMGLIASVYSLTLQYSYSPMKLPESELPSSLTHLETQPRGPANAHG